MIERLLDADALTLPGLRLLQYGSAPIRPATLSRAVSALPGVSFINMFGQTEGSPIACLVHADHERALAGRPDLLASVGRAAPGIELRLAGTDAEEVGEILARGAHLFQACRGRLAAHGRSGQNGRRRLRLPDRAAGRPDQARRRERPSRRGRRRTARAPGRAGGRGGRRTRPGVRSARSRVPRPGPGCSRAQPRGATRLRPRGAGRIQGAHVLGVRAGPAPQRQRQGPAPPPGRRDRPSA